MVSEEKVVTRRTVAKGAAWSVPVIALGAGAAQAQASGSTCADAACIKAGTPVGALPLGGVGLRALGVMTFVAGFDMSACSGVISAAVLLGVESATGTDASGTTHTPGIALDAGVGVDLFQQNVATPVIVAATWDSITTNEAIRKVCVTFDLKITLNVGTTLDSCPVTVCWNTPAGVDLGGLGAFTPSPA